MMTPTNSLAYRKAALQHASTVGLVIALYDTLHGNLSRAASAIDRKDIQSRCAELSHGFNVLQQLELMVNLERGEQATTNLRRFYAHLRRQMLAAQFKLSSDILRQQMKILIEVREAWQQVDARGTHPITTPQAYGAQVVHPDNNGNVYLRAVDLEIDRPSFSCSV